MIKFPTQLPGYPSLRCESMGILHVFNNSLLASCKICDRFPNNNLNAKTKWQKGATQAAISSHLVSYKKYDTFVRTIYTGIKGNLVLNFQ